MSIILICYPTNLHRSATDDASILSTSASSGEVFRERMDSGSSRHSSLSEKIFRSPRKSSKLIKALLL